MSPAARTYTRHSLAERLARALSPATMNLPPPRGTTYATMRGGTASDQ